MKLLRRPSQIATNSLDDFRQVLPRCRPQFSHLKAEEIGLNALPWSLPAFSFPDPLIPLWVQVCISQSVVRRLHVSEGVRVFASNADSRGHRQAYWLRIGERGKAGRNLYSEEDLGGFFGTLSLENDRYGLIRTIPFYLVSPVSQLSWGWEGMSNRDKFNRKSLIHLTILPEQWTRYWTRCSSCPHGAYRQVKETESKQIYNCSDAIDGRRGGFFGFGLVF